MEYSDCSTINNFNLANNVIKTDLVTFFFAKLDPRVGLKTDEIFDILIHIESVKNSILHNINYSSIIAFQ